ncbi:MAG: tRNA (adenosine(37)-N6)-dimethylallyltransferase MiaA, partial [Bdellovibrionota bacterium]
QRFLAVGGSGFYIQALEKGMFDVPDIPEEIKEDLTKELEGKGLEFLHRELVRRDPDSGKRIQPADKYRILRALEILRADPENRTLSEIKEHFDRHREAPPFRVSKLGLFRQRDVLRERVIERTRNMLKNGLVNEVHALRLEGLGSWNPMQSVGYAEVQAMLDGDLPEEQLVDAIVTSTMQLAKRQMTWFKKDASIQWFDVEAGLDGPLEAAKRLLDS